MLVNHVALSQQVCRDKCLPKPDWTSMPAVDLLIHAPRILDPVAGFLDNIQLAIQDGHVVAVFDKAIDQVAPDEPPRPRDQNLLIPPAQRPSSLNGRARTAPPAEAPSLRPNRIFSS